MFVSFFPRPRLFFWSAALWTLFAIGLWYGGGRAFGAHFGLGPRPPGAPPEIGVAIFWSPHFLWFYIYYALAVGLFAAAWRIVAPHRWWMWSILGSALIMLATYLQVEVNVAINAWYGPFWNLVQAAASHAAPVSIGAYYSLLSTFAAIVLVAVTLGVLTTFFVSHYVFRWRTAMNDYYIANWPKLRLIEGAAQRVQEDTMRFSSQTEDLGVSFINSVMTLIAFLPVLVALSTNIQALPVIGRIPQPLVLAAIVWSALGTGFLALLGVRLPGLQFRNQRVEAAYRKELVYGEDDPDRAQPPTMRELFAAVRHNYFRLYFNYAYFNVGRMLYLQVDTIFSLILVGPSVVAGVISFGLLQRIMDAFSQVSGSFEYLVNSWTDVVELMSIYKRLRGFEAAIHNQPQAPIEAELEAQTP